MSATRAGLDEKLTLLEARARELRPRAVAERYMPDYALDRALGAMLTVIGSSLAWRQLRERNHRRARIQEAMASYGRW